MWHFLNELKKEIGYIRGLEKIMKNQGCKGWFKVSYEAPSRYSFCVDFDFIIASNVD